ncbi:TetR/AcrR family transcriptional regulator [Promethearchaeum syntrophicum]|uniref:TetR/AcrR family transcriptional regulator n=1 Tax=Promethearchaeum syntrophicum TaxID=2594042 RepID=A0A5B9D686_9ARCH|nr:TetR/AcrR family transcriptional regulator [Candidatus Prometheoarchaeum syntrophicum]QEE14515.1 DNA-binding transcriptional regulator EnvR [Candidatus Prometheoarchaeum syntrophicum]
MMEKSEIIVTAQEIFERFGYKKTTLKDIGEAVGLDKTSLYHYFKNKEDLFIEVLLLNFQRYKDQFTTISQPLSVQEQVYLFFEYHLKFFLKNSLFSQLISLDFKLLSKNILYRIVEVREYEYQFFSNLIEEGISKGEIRNLNTKQIVTTFFHLLEGLKRNITSNQLIHKEEPDLKLILADIRSSIALFFTGIKKLT